MAFLLRILTIVAIFVVHQAEWIEITKNPKSNTETTTTRPKSIRILKRHEAQLFYTTPSPIWLEYQRERFGQKQNSNSQKLIVTSENRLKNSVEIIVPANQVPQSQIIQTRTRLDVVNNKPKDEILELQITPQTTTTKREMSDLNEYVDDDNENNHDEITQANPVHKNNNKPQTESSSESSNVQMPSWQGFLKFLKTIQANWLKQSGFSIEDKIRILKNLRDNLMQKIEEQFSMIWAPDEYLQRRQKRGILDDSNLNFPPEAALMSINFLTFAVFLIKLVLQIVHLIKSKHYNFTGLGITTQPLGKTTLKT